MQAASLTYQYTFARDFSTFNTVVGLAVTGPLPVLFLQPMFSVTVALGSHQVGDQISNVRLYAERFVTGPSGYSIGMVEVHGPAEQSIIDLATVAA